MKKYPTYKTYYIESLDVALSASPSWVKYHDMGITLLSMFLERGCVVQKSFVKTFDPAVMKRISIPPELIVDEPPFEYPLEEFANCVQKLSTAYPHEYVVRLFNGMRRLYNTTPRFWKHNFEVIWDGKNIPRFRTTGDNSKLLSSLAKLTYYQKSDIVMKYFLMMVQHITHSWNMEEYELASGFWIAKNGAHFNATDVTRESAEKMASGSVEFSDIKAVYDIVIQNIFYIVAIGTKDHSVAGDMAMKIGRYINTRMVARRAPSTLGSETIPYTLSNASRELHIEVLYDTGTRQYYSLFPKDKLERHLKYEYRLK
jgi:hypothetical protein